MADQHRRNLKILMFPYLACGHISPFLELAKRLSERGGFSILFCSTPINFSFIKKKISDTKYSNSIHLVEFHLQELPQLPPHYHTTNGLPRHLNPTLRKALKMSKPQFHQILEAQRPDILIYDFMQPWASRVASIFNIPAVTLAITTAAMSCYYAHPLCRPGVDFPFQAIYLKDYEQPKGADEGEPEEDHSQEDIQESPGMLTLLVNSSRAIDAKYEDYLAEICQAKVVPIGAQIQQDYANVGHGDHMELFKWLGKQKEHSTVYVCVGSEYFLTKEEIEEMAHGLELSHAPFIWVVRFPTGEEVVRFEDVLPDGFLERTGERGRIVQGWSPQVKILKHPSIGAFLTHCGWNSILESIEFGVPIIALPVHYDQPFNARLMVEIGVALEVERDETGKFHRDKIAEVIKDVIHSDEIGEGLRRKVKTLGENVRMVREEEIDGVVEAITEICKKSPSKNTLA